MTGGPEAAHAEPWFRERACPARLAGEVRARGSQPVVVDVSEFLKAGGGPRCLTLALDVRLGAHRPGAPPVHAAADDPTRVTGRLVGDGQAVDGPAVGGLDGGKAAALADRRTARTAGRHGGDRRA